MYFTGQSLETTKELEATLGRYEYEDDKGYKVVRALMTNDEIRTIKSSRAILICGNYAAIMAKLVPYYKNRLYRNLSAIKHEYKGNIPFVKAPVLDLSNLTVPAERISAFNQNKANF
jgi:type IV secretory pathway TraG/TraD family ATPase VirD4